MGTNYYLTKDACPSCGRGDDKIHIGKSSAGWCFALHVYPEGGINSLEDWKREFASPGAVISDEYGALTTIAYMMETITLRDWPLREQPRPAAYLAQNHAVDGPNGLMRHAVDGRHCIGHGEGTWDYLIGDYS